MGLFSLSQKVYTSDTAPEISAENVGVEGKRYPTHMFGRFISNYPCLMMATFFIPLAFFVVGCVYISPDMSYSLNDYQISSTIPVRRDAVKINGVLDSWAESLSGTNLLQASVNPAHERSIREDTLELRAVVDLETVVEARKKNLLTDGQVSRFSNMLSTEMMVMYRRVESAITEQEGYGDICFTNDLRNGVVSNAYPPCVPVSSITQILFPTRRLSSWYLDGNGSYFQLDYLPRLFSNPSYGWFFDNNFSMANPVARQLRSQFTFARSKGEDRTQYLNRMQAFLPKANRYVADSVNIYYAKMYLGGGSSQDLLMEIAGRNEGYKVGVAAVICFALSWWHCGTFVVGLYTVAQTVFVYMAAVGLYALIYGTLPLSTYSAIIWVTTFCMHGTLSFYDMFVYSGIMATKGRQNNLSVAQRLCFTIRRISVGVWIADVLAIVIFAINTTSLFNSVVQFSVFMMIALLWNMYCIVLPTPALVVLHHMYFANKRRNLQKQSDVLNAAMQGCRRSEHLVNVLGAVQDNIADNEKPYWLDEDVIKSRIGANRGINKRTYKGPGNFLRAQFDEGMDKIYAARHDVVGALHKVKKTKQAVVDGGKSNEVELPPVQLQDFLQVGDANPLADDAGAGANGQRAYYNPRMVFPSDLIHIPATYVERSEECWINLCSAIGQSTHDVNGDVVPPRAYGLKRQGTGESEAAAFAERWRNVGRELEIETTSNSRTATLVPLAVRNVVRSSDPAMIVGTATGDTNAKQGAVTAFAVVDEGRPGVQATGGPSGFGIAKLRYRWTHRDDVRRSRCCGMFGKVANENPEERMRRLMARKVKRDGYSFFERFLLSYFLPAVYRVRFLFLALLLAMFVALCIAGSFIKAGGLPNTLISGQEKAAATFVAMDDTFGMRGNCTFCSPYYRSVQDYRRSTVPDISACSSKYGYQMNLYADACGVCNGTNACVDCAGITNGDAIRDDCGGCSVPDAPTPTKCTCTVTRNCSYCDWAVGGLLIPSDGTCTTVCPAVDTCGAHGTCDQYTAKCDCAAGYGGDTCSEARTDCGPHGALTAAGTCTCNAGWSGASCDMPSECGMRGQLLSAAESPTGVEMCGCMGHWRGATCQVCDCMNGGMCDDVTGECQCVGAFVGPRCETCAANCTLRGTCPDVTTPDYSLWNVRTCIANACTEPGAASDVNTITETMCTACERTGTTGVATACGALPDQGSCMANSECWWYAGSAGTPYCGLARVNNDTSSLDCKCTYSGVWSGETCGTCLAPAGASCLEDGTVLGCNGLAYTTASTAMSTDTCGVCGGNGLCRGCDGIPGSGAVFDICGVCGGDGTCTGTSTADPVYVDYLFDLNAVPQIVGNPNWCKVVATIANQLRLSDGTGSQAKTVVEDYLDGTADYSVESISDFYHYVVANGRLSEAVFMLNTNREPVTLEYIRYRMQSTVINSESSANMVVSYYYWIEKYLVGPFREFATANNVSVSYTSTNFQPAVARVGALQSLWFAVGIGLAVTFVLLLVYYVSVTMAAAATMVAAIVCFGSLTVCMMFNWEVDAVLQVCISCTVPIGVEYVVHFCSGYFDYLQTTTSHLFAKDVTRRTAVQGALLRCASAVCTSAVAVILISIMFDVSQLTPLKRCGQISITLHLLILIAGIFFIGAVAAFGPMKVYQHWTLSSLLCIVCAVLAAAAVLIMYGANGVLGPHANKILAHN